MLLITSTLEWIMEMIDQIWSGIDDTNGNDIFNDEWWLVTVTFNTCSMARFSVGGWQRNWWRLHHPFEISIFIRVQGKKSGIYNFTFPWSCKTKTQQTSSLNGRAGTAKFWHADLGQLYTRHWYKSYSQPYADDHMCSLQICVACDSIDLKSFSFSFLRICWWHELQTSWFSGNDRSIWACCWDFWAKVASDFVKSEWVSKGKLGCPMILMMSVAWLFSQLVPPMIAILSRLRVRWRGQDTTLPTIYAAGLSPKKPS